jgi:O-antigen/teichoic acid export membrane protein
MSTRLLALNAFWSLVSHALSRGSLLLSSVVLARSLSTSDFAAYSYFQMTISMLAAYAGLGLGVTASRYFAVIGYENERDHSKPIGMLWTLSIFTAAIAAICIFAISGNSIGNGLSVPKWMLMFGVFVVAAQVVPSGAIIGLEKYRLASLVSLLSAITLLIGMTYASLNTSSSAGMLTVVIAGLVQLGGEASIVLRAVGLRRMFPQHWFRFSHIKDIGTFAGPMLFVSLLAASGSWLLGQLILHISGARPFAIYAVGMQWFGLALVLPGIVSRIVLPRVVRMGANSPVERKQLVRRSALVSALAAVVLALLGAFFGSSVMGLYGSDYSENRWVIACYLAAAIFSAPANTLGNAIVADDGQKVWLMLTILWLVTLLVAGAAVAPFGHWAGALAQGAAALMLTLFAIIAARVKKIV